MNLDEAVKVLEEIKNIDCNNYADTDNKRNKQHVLTLAIELIERVNKDKIIYILNDRDAIGRKIIDSEPETIAQAITDYLKGEGR